MRWDLTRNGPNRNLLRAGILVIAFLLVAILGYRQFQRSKGVSVNVWVTAAELPSGTVLKDEHLTQVSMLAKEVPPGTVRDRKNIEGRTLADAKPAGEPFRRADFAPPDAGPGLAGALPEGRVLMFVPIMGLPMTEITDELRFGDRLDLIAIGGRRSGLEDPTFASRARPVARDVYYIGWVAPRGPAAADGGDDDSQDEGIGSLLTSAIESQAGSGGGGGGMSALLLGIHPEDVMPLSEAQAAGAPMAMVLHGRKEVEAGKMLVLPRPRLNEVELIRGDSRTRIPLRRTR